MLNNVERHVRHVKKLSGVRGGKTDESDRERGKEFRTRREIFRCPAPEENALVPANVTMRRNRGNVFGDEANYIRGRVVNLRDVNQHIRIGGGGRWTLISSNSQIFSWPSCARNSKSSDNRGMCS